MRRKRNDRIIIRNHSTQNSTPEAIILGSFTIRWLNGYGYLDIELFYGSDFTPAIITSVTGNTVLDDFWNDNYHFIANSIVHGDNQNFLGGGLYNVTYGIYGSFASNILTLLLNDGTNLPPSNGPDILTESSIAHAVQELTGGVTLSDPIVFTRPNTTLTTDHNVSGLVWIGGFMISVLVLDDHTIIAHFSQAISTADFVASGGRIKCNFDTGGEFLADSDIDGDTILFISVDPIATVGDTFYMDFLGTPIAGLVIPQPLITST